MSTATAHSQLLQCLSPARVVLLAHLMHSRRHGRVRLSPGQAGMSNATRYLTVTQSDVQQHEVVAAGTVSRHLFEVLQWCRFAKNLLTLK
jgi:hypothetical protein